MKRRVSRQHVHIGEARQLGDDVLRQAVGEIVVFGVGREVVEGQHGDDRPASDGTLGVVISCVCLFSADAERAVGTDRRADVFQILLAEIDELGIDAPAHGAVREVGNHDAARLGEGFKARGNVDAVAIDGAVGILHDIAEMHAYAERHALVFGHRPVGGGDIVLDRQRRTHRTGGALEHGKHRIPGGIDDAAGLGRGAGMECGPPNLQGRHRRCLVGTHQARIAHRIRGENGRKSLPDGIVVQSARFPLLVHGQRQQG